MMAAIFALRLLVGTGFVVAAAFLGMGLGIFFGLPIHTEGCSSLCVLDATWAGFMVGFFMLMRAG